MSETNPATDQATPPAANAAPREWNAHDWVQDAFKDDPSFKDLSPEDVARLEEIADKAHADVVDAAEGWAESFVEEHAHDLPERVREGLESSPETASWLEQAAADGKIDDAEGAQLKTVVQEMTPAEQMGVARPIVEGFHAMEEDLIDGVELVVDTAVEGGLEVYEARADMPGGDNDVNQDKIVKLTEAREELDHVFEFERGQMDYQWGKAEEAMDLIEAGTDPKVLPPDTDTYQVDDNQDQYETADA